jgi:hypothetical membrane protein
MGRETRLLRTFQAGLVLGGSFALFAVLDVVLAAVGIYPWTDVAPAVVRLVLGIIISGLAFVVAGFVWREREEQSLGGVTFSDLVIVVGFMLVGGFLLLGALR